MSEENEQQPSRTAITLAGNVTGFKVRGTTFVGYDKVIVAKDVDGIGPSDIGFDDVNAYREQPTSVAAPIKKPWHKDVLYQVVAGVVVLALTLILAHFGLKS
ncbi:hypothetical protein [Pseudomonas fluorescens]|uniref:hypothetical protein n=1 Tax=Pseudomonas fluorescens TaxID=294 RepID=UPI002859CD19|nr:hypothetical protein [Pseudomonas fluorescens]MDR6162370.1 hypothetical protein [Pseudomonas fluorescens]